MSSRVVYGQLEIRPVSDLDRLPEAEQEEVSGELVVLVVDGWWYLVSGGRLWTGEEVPADFGLAPVRYAEVSWGKWAILRPIEYLDTLPACYAII
jgi:hypothetical protein